VSLLGSKDGVIIVLHCPVRRGPRVTPGHGVCDAVVRVRVQFGGDPLARRLWAARILLIPADQKLGGLVEILGGEIWTQVGPMAVDRTVFHQPVALKHVHPAEHIVAGEENLFGRYDLRGQWRLVTVHEIGQDAEDGKPDQVGQESTLKPPTGNRHRLTGHLVPPPTKSVSCATAL
jgi:hypothetical protein